MSIFQPLPLTSELSGKRKFSATLGSSVHYPPSFSALSVRAWNFDPNTKYNFEIPTETESAAALVYIGFVESTAMAIHEQYTNHPEPDWNHIVYLWTYFHSGIKRI